jgi:Ni/Co efflux regulator RcnB
MKIITMALAAAALVAVAAPAAFARPHPEWHKGAKMGHDDWGHAAPVDYHARHLPAPRHGYEWRDVDGNYVMAAVATGVIASVIAHQ